MCEGVGIGNGDVIRCHRTGGSLTLLMGGGSGNNEFIAILLPVSTWQNEDRVHVCVCARGEGGFMTDGIDAVMLYQ